MNRFLLIRFYVEEKESTATGTEKLTAEGKTPMTPKEGRIYDASIPAAKSGFKVRDAMVYLPPAALSAEPPELPVMVPVPSLAVEPSRVSEIAPPLLFLISTGMALFCCAIVTLP